MRGLGFLRGVLGEGEDDGTQDMIRWPSLLLVCPEVCGEVDEWWGI